MGKNWRQKTRPDHHKPRKPQGAAPGSGCGPKGCRGIKAREAQALTCFSERSFGKLKGSDCSEQKDKTGRPDKNARIMGAGESEGNRGLEKAETGRNRGETAEGEAGDNCRVGECDFGQV